MHIPKTAGTTVTSMFTAAYSSDGVRGAGNYLRHPRETRREMERVRWTGEWAGEPVVVGHVPYGLFARHLPPDTRYMTFLREPVDRVLSHYHRHVERKSRTGSIAEALEAGMPELNDLATRFLCGDPAPLGELPPGALDDAKANLGGFAFVGIQERFEESVALLQRTFGLPPVPYLNRHVSADRPAAHAIPGAERAAIEDHNRLDAELYAFALERFEEAVAAAGAGFEEEVARLRALSREANDEEIRAASEWLERELPSGATRAKPALYAAAEEAGISLAALKDVLARSPVRKVKDPDGHRVLMRTGDGGPSSDQP